MTLAEEALSVVQQWGLNLTGEYRSTQRTYVELQDYYLDHMLPVTGFDPGMNTYLDYLLYVVIGNILKVQRILGNLVFVNRRLRDRNF